MIKDGNMRYISKEIVVKHHIPGSHKEISTLLIFPIILMNTFINLLICCTRKNIVKTDITNRPAMRMQVMEEGPSLFWLSSSTHLVTIFLISFNNEDFAYKT